MAPKRSLQQHSSDERDTKRKGKEALEEDKDEKMIPKHDSSSESAVEDEEEGLDEWEKEARRWTTQEASNEWRPWTTVELAMIEMGGMAARLEAVPFTGELDDSDLGPEVIFDTHYFDEEENEVAAAVQTTEDATDQKSAEQGQGIEDSDLASSPQKKTDNDQVAPSEDGAATVDASNAAEDPSSSIPPTSPK